MAKQKKGKSTKTTDSVKTSKGSKRKKSKPQATNPVEAMPAPSAKSSDMATKPINAQKESVSDGIESSETVVSANEPAKPINGKKAKVDKPVEIQQVPISEEMTVSEPITSPHDQVSLEAKADESVKAQESQISQKIKPKKAAKKAQVKVAPPEKPLPQALSQAQPHQPPVIDATQAIGDWFSLMNRFATSTVSKLVQDAWDYYVDSSQRSLMFMDTLRQRGNNMIEHYQDGLPPLLDYEYEVILDGRQFDRPVNYQLLYIIPPNGIKPAPDRRPLVVLDPRAGHGPGIGGFKQDSAVGMGLREGHIVYFVSFTEQPCEGQTMDDVLAAQVRFLEEVSKRHPDHRSPIVYGNCQAGWSVALLGADRPDVTGPIVINGAPLSYWAGSEGVNPMRLNGGLSGGSWTALMLSDMGLGYFDGANLVINFEMLNPAHTFWKKEYNLYDKIDTEQQRYLDFEKWWNGFFLLNEEEIRWIVNNLFIGDKTEQGKLQLKPGHTIDLRNLDDPLVVFASSGDNITPPHQALHWISELYPTTQELKDAGQRIVYLLHSHIGHLGIFVSAAVARREHRAIIEHIEDIRNLKPGLYQMFIDMETQEPDPLKDQFVVRFEERDVQDVRFPVDQTSFKKIVELSKVNEAMYLNFGRPLIQSFWQFPYQADLLRWSSPARTSRYVFSDKFNPFMSWFESGAALAKQYRQSVDETNVFRYAEHRFSDHLVSMLDAFREQRDNVAELVFNMTYSD